MVFDFEICIFLRFVVENLNLIVVCFYRLITSTYSETLHDDHVNLETSSLEDSDSNDVEENARRILFDNGDGSFEYNKEAENSRKLLSGTIDISPYAQGRRLPSSNEFTEKFFLHPKTYSRQKINHIRKSRDDFRDPFDTERNPFIQRPKKKPDLTWGANSFWSEQDDRRLLGNDILYWQTSEQNQYFDDGDDSNEMPSQGTNIGNTVYNDNYMYINNDNLKSYMINYLNAYLQNSPVWQTPHSKKHIERNFVTSLNNIFPNKQITYYYKYPNTIPKLFWVLYNNPVQNQFLSYPFIPPTSRTYPTMNVNFRTSVRRITKKPFTDLDLLEADDLNTLINYILNWNTNEGLDIERKMITSRKKYPVRANLNMISLEDILNKLMRSNNMPGSFNRSPKRIGNSFMSSVSQKLNPHYVLNRIKPELNEFRNVFTSFGTPKSRSSPSNLHGRYKIRIPHLPNLNNEYYSQSYDKPNINIDNNPIYFGFPTHSYPRNMQNKIVPGIRKINSNYNPEYTTPITQQDSTPIYETSTYNRDIPFVKEPSFSFPYSRKKSGINFPYPKNKPRMSYSIPEINIPFNTEYPKTSQEDFGPMYKTKTYPNNVNWKVPLNSNPIEDSQFGFNRPDSNIPGTSGYFTTPDHSKQIYGIKSSYFNSIKPSLGHNYLKQHYPHSFKKMKHRPRPIYEKLPSSSEEIPLETGPLYNTHYSRGNSKVSYLKPSNPFNLGPISRTTPIYTNLGYKKPLFNYPEQNLPTSSEENPLETGPLYNTHYPRGNSKVSYMKPNNPFDLGSILQTTTIYPNLGNKKPLLNYPGQNLPTSSDENPSDTGPLYNTHYPRGNSKVSYMKPNNPFDLGSILQTTPIYPNLGYKKPSFNYPGQNLPTSSEENPLVTGPLYNTNYPRGNSKVSYMKPNNLFNLRPIPGTTPIYPNLGYKKPLFNYPGQNLPTSSEEMPFETEPHGNPSVSFMKPNNPFNLRPVSQTTYQYPNLKYKKPYSHYPGGKMSTSSDEIPYETGPLFNSHYSKDNNYYPRNNPAHSFVKPNNPFNLESILQTTPFYSNLGYKKPFFSYPGEQTTTSSEEIPFGTGSLYNTNYPKGNPKVSYMKPNNPFNFGIISQTTPLYPNRGYKKPFFNYPSDKLPTSSEEIPFGPLYNTYYSKGNPRGSYMKPNQPFNLGPIAYTTPLYPNLGYKKPFSNYPGEKLPISSEEMPFETEPLYNTHYPKGNSKVSYMKPNNLFNFGIISQTTPLYPNLDYKNPLFNHPGDKLPTSSEEIPFGTGPLHNTYYSKGNPRDNYMKPNQPFNLGPISYTTPLYPNPGYKKLIKNYPGGKLPTSSEEMPFETEPLYNTQYPNGNSRVSYMKQKNPFNLKPILQTTSLYPTSSEEIPFGTGPLYNTHYPKENSPFSYMKPNNPFNIGLILQTTPLYPNQGYKKPFFNHPGHNIPTSSKENPFETGPLYNIYHPRKNSEGNYMKPNGPFNWGPILQTTPIYSNFGYKKPFSNYPGEKLPTSSEENPFETEPLYNSHYSKGNPRVSFIKPNQPFNLGPISQTTPIYSNFGYKKPFSNYPGGKLPTSSEENPFETGPSYNSHYPGENPRVSYMKPNQPYNFGPISQTTPIYSNFGYKKPFSNYPGGKLPTSSEENPFETGPLYNSHYPTGNPRVSYIKPNQPYNLGPISQTTPIYSNFGYKKPFSNYPGGKLPTSSEENPFETGPSYNSHYPRGNPRVNYMKPNQPYNLRPISQTKPTYSNFGYKKPFSNYPGGRLPTTSEENLFETGPLYNSHYPKGNPRVSYMTPNQPYNLGPILQTTQIYPNLGYKKPSFNYPGENIPTSSEEMPFETGPKYNTHYPNGNPGVSFIKQRNPLNLGAIIQTTQLYPNLDYNYLGKKQPTSSEEDSFETGPLFNTQYPKENSGVSFMKPSNLFNSGPVSQTASPYPNLGYKKPFFNNPDENLPTSSEEIPFETKSLYTTPYYPRGNPKVSYMKPNTLFNLGPISQTTPFYPNLSYKKPFFNHLGEKIPTSSEEAPFETGPLYNTQYLNGKPGVSFMQPNNPYNLGLSSQTTPFNPLYPNLGYKKPLFNYPGEKPSTSSEEIPFGTGPLYNTHYPKKNPGLSYMKPNNPFNLGPISQTTQIYPNLGYKKPLFNYPGKNLPTSSEEIPFETEPLHNTHYSNKKPGVTFMQPNNPYNLEPSSRTTSLYPNLGYNKPLSNYQGEKPSTSSEEIPFGTGPLYNTHYPKENSPFINMNSNNPFNVGPFLQTTSLYPNLGYKKPYFNHPSSKLPTSSEEVPFETGPLYNTYSTNGKPGVNFMKPNNQFNLGPFSQTTPLYPNSGYKKPFFNYPNQKLSTSNEETPFETGPLYNAYYPKENPQVSIMKSKKPFNFGTFAQTTPLHSNLGYKTPFFDYPSGKLSTSSEESSFETEPFYNNQYPRRHPEVSNMKPNIPFNLGHISQTTPLNSNPGYKNPFPNYPGGKPMTSSEEIPFGTEPLYNGYHTKGNSRVTFMKPNKSFNVGSILQTTPLYSNLGYKKPFSNYLDGKLSTSSEEIPLGTGPLYNTYYPRGKSRSFMKPNKPFNFGLTLQTTPLYPNLNYKKSFFNRPGENIPTNNKLLNFNYPEGSTPISLEKQDRYPLPKYDYFSKLMPQFSSLGYETRSPYFDINRPLKTRPNKMTYFPKGVTNPIYGKTIYNRPNERKPIFDYDRLRKNSLPHNTHGKPTFNYPIGNKPKYMLGVTPEYFSPFFDYDVTKYRKPYFGQSTPSFDGPTSITFPTTESFVYNPTNIPNFGSLTNNLPQYNRIYKQYPQQYWNLQPTMKTHMTKNPWSTYPEGLLSEQPNIAGKPRIKSLMPNAEYSGNVYPVQQFKPDFSQQYPETGVQQYPTANTQLYPRAGIQQYPGAGMQQYPTANFQQYPRTSVQQYPGTGAQQYPTANTQLYPRAGIQQYPEAGVQQYPTANTQLYPRAGIRHHPGAGVQLYPTANTQLYPRAGIPQYPKSSVQIYPGSNVQQYPGANVKQYPGTNVQQYPGANVQQYPGASIQQYPGASVQQYPRASVQQYPGKRVQQYPGTSVQQYPRASIQQYLGASIQQYPRGGVQQYPRGSVQQYPRASVQQYPGASVQSLLKTQPQFQQHYFNSPLSPSVLCNRRKLINSMRKPMLKARKVRLFRNSLNVNPDFQGILKLVNTYSGNQNQNLDLAVQVYKYVYAMILQKLAPHTEPLEYFSNIWDRIGLRKLGAGSFPDKLLSDFPPIFHEFNREFINFIHNLNMNKDQSWPGTRGELPKILWLTYNSVQSDKTVNDIFRELEPLIDNYVRNYKTGLYQ